MHMAWQNIRMALHGMAEYTGILTANQTVLNYLYYLLFPHLLFIPGFMIVPQYPRVEQTLNINGIKANVTTNTELSQLGF